MNRDIQFRAWQFNGGIMLPNVQNHIGTDTGFGVLLRDSDEYAVMQYTGITDRNDQKIYEGDILRVSDLADSLHVLTWQTDHWAIKHIRSGWVNHDRHWAESEIIGNIHENPELLEVL